MTTIAGAVHARLAALDREDAIARIWARDHTLWKDDPTELADRLGWLDSAERMAAEAPALRAFAREVAAEGFTTAVLLGMGGSSLAPEVLRASLGVAPGMLDLVVLDTTDPRQIAAVEGALDLDRTLFIVASKSGGTIETRTQFDYFWERRPEGRHFAAITNPGSSLDALAAERGLRRTFRNDPEIGGRYSALSFFGLVPAALIGADLGALLAGAQAMAAACAAGRPAAENPGAVLGAWMAEAALAGCDKLTLVLPDALATLGAWIEQLVAESTGKEGRGIVPVDGEPLAAPEVYGDDRLFVAYGDDQALGPLEAAGHPVLRLPAAGPSQLGAEVFRWEFATAVAGAILGINPFDQPNVQEAKDRTNRVLAGERVDAATSSLDALLATVRPGDYLAICAFLPRDAAGEALLQRARLALRDRYRVATTLGFGPRFLHSTGQLHKGGPNTGFFLQVTDTPAVNLAIPGRPYTFGQLQAAQALGDLAALQAHHRRVARITPDEL